MHFKRYKKNICVSTIHETLMHLILHAVCACHCTTTHVAMKLFQWSTESSEISFWCWFGQSRGFERVHSSHDCKHNCILKKKENVPEDTHTILGKKAAKYAKPQESRHVSSSHVQPDNFPHNLKVTPLPPSLCDKWSAHRCNPHWPPLGVPPKEKHVKFGENSFLENFLGNSLEFPIGRIRRNYFTASLLCFKTKNWKISKWHHRNKTNHGSYGQQIKCKSPIISGYRPSGTPIVGTKRKTFQGHTIMISGSTSGSTRTVYAFTWELFENGKSNHFGYVFCIIV